MQKPTLLLTLIFATNFVFSQGWLPMGGRSKSMANSTVSISDAWAFHHNPGALAEVKKTEVGVSYENRFLLKDLQSQGLVVVQPLKSGVVSFGAQFFGHQLFRTQRIGVGYSLQLSDKFFGGVQLNYQGVQLADNYGRKNGVSAEIGGVAIVNEYWRIGFSIFNINRAKLSSFKEDRFTTLLRFGTAYTVSKKVLVTAELEKNVAFTARLKMGVEYQLSPTFYLRSGWAMSPMELTFGFGKAFNTLKLDVGSAYHQHLGWSPHFSITFSAQ